MNFLLSKFKKNNFGFVEILSRLVNWGCLPLVSFIIEPAIFGQIVLLYSFIIVLSALSGFGQHRALLMYGADDDYVIFYVFIITMLSSLVIFLTSWFFFDLNFYILLAIILNVLVNNFVYLCRSKSNFRDFAFYRVGSSLSRLVFVVSFLLIEPSINSYIFAEIASVFVVLLLSLFVGTLDLNLRLLKIDLKRLLFYFSFGLPLFLQACMTQISQVADRFIVSYSLGDVALANYFFISIFCSSVAFIFAFNAQKYEVAIYRSENLSAAKESLMKFIKKSLDHVVKFYFISLLIYFLSTILVNKYEFDFWFMTLLYLYFASNLAFLSLTFLLTYKRKNQLIFVLSVFSALSFISMVFFSISYVGLYAIPLAGLVVSFLMTFFLKYSLEA